MGGRPRRILAEGIFGGWPWARVWPRARAKMGGGRGKEDVRRWPHPGLWPGRGKDGVRFWVVPPRDLAWAMKGLGVGVIIGNVPPHTVPYP